MPARQHSQSFPTTGKWKPHMTATFLPGCPCGDRHPLAYKPPIDSATCLNCGAEVAAPGETVDVPAKTGFWLVIPNLLHRIAKWLLSLAERL